jgi:hypothetical protein
VSGNVGGSAIASLNSLAICCDAGAFMHQHLSKPWASRLRTRIMRMRGVATTCTNIVYIYR